MRKRVHHDENGKYTNTALHDRVEALCREFADKLVNEAGKGYDILDIEAMAHPLFAYHIAVLHHKECAKSNQNNQGVDVEID